MFNRHDNAAGQEAKAEAIDPVTRLRLLTCPTCGILSAVPAGFHVLRARQRQPIYCPCGHANVPDDPQQAPADAATLLDELATLRLQLEAQAAELNRLRIKLHEPRSIDFAELKRRSNMLAGQSEASSNKGYICIFCGKSKAGVPMLASHIYRQHREEVRAMPPERFK